MEGRSFQGLDREMNKKYLLGIGGLLLGTAMALHSIERRNQYEKTISNRPFAAGRGH